MAIQARRKGAGKKNQKGKKQNDQKKKQKNKKSDDQRKGSISSLPQDNYPESDRQIGSLINRALREVDVLAVLDL